MIRSMPCLSPSIWSVIDSLLLEVSTVDRPAGTGIRHQAQGVSAYQTAAVVIGSSGGISQRFSLISSYELHEAFGGPERQLPVGHDGREYVDDRLPQ
jgi:hypothetical protein